LRNIEALATADPLNDGYQKSLTESQTWLASSLAAEGQLEEATRLREQHVSRLQQLLARTGDVEYRQKLVPAERYLGELYAFQGRVPEALARFRAAVGHSDDLLSREPTNSRWNYFAARAKVNLAGSLLAANLGSEAAAAAQSACRTTERLIATDSNVQRWRAVLRDCWQAQARVALASNDLSQALRHAQQATRTAKSVRSTDPVDDRYAAAQTHRLLGDIQRRAGNDPAARAAWAAGLALVPRGVPEQPWEMAERAMLLARLGSGPEAQLLTNRLRSIGYLQKELSS
jgi:tetratricopeptide (TPR) repeat protein